MTSYKKQYRPQPVTGPRWRNDSTRRAVFYAYLALVAVTGGASRSDVLSLVFLRPASLIVIGYALAAAMPGQISRFRFLLWMLLAWAGFIAVQLLPLPPAIWTALPGRGFIADVDQALGLGGLWRPWSLAPSKTLNALLSLSTPLAVLLLFAIQPLPRIRPALLAIGAMGAASIVISLLQVVGSDNSLLYTYRITNPGSAVGLFANRNHNAIFLASLVPIATYLVLTRSNQYSPGPERLATVTTIFIFLAVPTVLLTGSRAGTAALAVTLVLTAILWAWLRRRPRSWAGEAKLTRFAVPLSLGAIAALTAMLVATSRARALDRFFTASVADDLRIAVLPTLGKLAATYFPFGSGLGTFYLVYQVVEPRDLLRPQYLNQAHNDPLQLLIEGGLPAVLFAVVFLAWFAHAGVRAVRALPAARADRTAPMPLLPFAWLSFAILLVTSLVDYPLRTPLLMAIATLLACVMTTVPRVRPDKADPT